jgi:hypothetical protein
VIGAVPNATSVVLAVANPLVAGSLVAAGAFKLRRPDPTARALSAAGLPGHAGTARALGLAEVVVGVGALLSPSVWTDGAVSATYLAFAGFLGFLLLARPGTGPCGCAGARDVPPSVLHLGVNLVASTAAAGAALAPPPGLGALAGSLGWAMLPFSAGVIAAALLVTAVIADVPSAFRSYRPPSGHPVERRQDRHARADAALVTAGIGPGHPSLWPEALTGEADG